jgi:hypothetical protein
MYPLWGTAPAPNCHVLTRAMGDRVLVGEGVLFAAARQFPMGRAAQHRTAGARCREAQEDRSVGTALWRGGAGRAVSVTTACRPA